MYYNRRGGGASLVLENSSVLRC
uniref:Uncharacterized protein n=1 Tax=Anguilla anguilla TaxID=7936 RepID=A0A0E9PCC1_ANGAN